MSSLKRTLTELEHMSSASSDISWIDIGTVNRAIYYLEEYRKIVDKDPVYEGKVAFDEKVQKRLAALDAEIKGV